MEHTHHTDPANRLRLVLATNGATSGLTGLISLVASGRVSEWLGVAHSGWVRLIGAGLVVFAVAVFELSRTSVPRLVRWAPVVSVADGGWVVASVATVVAGWYSRSGAVVVGCIAVMVGAFAVAQVRLSRPRLVPAAS